MTEPIDFQTQLDAALARLQSAEASMESRVTQMINAQRTVMDSLQAKIAAQAPHIDISTELDTLNSIATSLTRFEVDAAFAAPVPTDPTPTDPVPTDPVPTDPTPAPSSPVTTESTHEEAPPVP